MIAIGLLYLSLTDCIYDAVVVQNCCCIRSPQPVATIDDYVVYSMHDSCCNFASTVSAMVVRTKDGDTDSALALHKCVNHRIINSCYNDIIFATYVGCKRKDVGCTERRS